LAGIEFFEKKKRKRAEQSNSRSKIPPLPPPLYQLLMSLTSNSTANNLNDPNDLFDLSVEQYIQKYVFGCNTFEDPHPPPHPPPPRPPAFFHFTHDDSTVQNIINKLELSPFVSNLFIQEEEGTTFLFVVFSIFYFFVSFPR
jgi:hypothetical protein